MGDDRHGQRDKARPRHGDTARVTSLSQSPVVPRLRPLHDPGLIDKLCEIDLAAARRPLAQCASGNHQLVIEKRFDIQIIRWPFLGLQRPSPSENEVILSITQVPKVARAGSRSNLVEMQDHTWIFFNEPFKYVRDDGESDRERACNPDFARCRISQMLDVPDTLFQFVEYCCASFEQRIAVHSWLDSLRRSIQKSHAKRMLKISDDPRDRRLGNSELYSRFSHA